MAYLALVSMGLFGFVCVGVRSWIHRRQTGDTPFRNGPVGHGAAALVAFALPFVAGAVLDLTGTLGRVAHAEALGVAGAVLAAGGVVATMWAQLAMGASWRIGVDETERTALVTTGPYRFVRNPIYTAMFVFALGQALLVPNVVTIAGLVVVVAAVDGVVRRVEEPYLESVHGAAYRAWTAATGRFLPGVGRT